MGAHGGWGDILGRRRVQAKSEAWASTDCVGGLDAKLCPTPVTPWTVACQAPLSMEFPRQEYWSGLPFPSLDPSISIRDRTRVSCIAGRFFTNLAMREARANPLV